MSNPNNPYGSQPEPGPWQQGADPYGSQYGQQYGQPSYGQQQYGQPPVYGGQLYAVPYSASGQLAGWGSRLWGYFVDGFILNILFWVTAVPLAAIVDNEEGFVLLIPLFMAVYFGYFAYFWTQQRGQTLGMKVAGIRVVRLDGQPMTVGQSIIRVLGYLLNSFGFYLGWLWPLWDDRRQGWHDKIAGTIVVRA